MPEYYRLNKRAYDAEKVRNYAGAATAGLWLYNVLDAILFFPDYGISISGTSLSVTPEVDLDGARIVGRVTF